MTTILIKKKDTAGAPASGDLTNAAGGAEIAVNTATKRIYSKDSGGTVIEMGTFPSTMAVQGALSATGNVTLGDASADSVTVNGTITSNLIFTDATYDIGASGATRPRDMFLSRNLTVGGTLTLAGGVNLNGNVTVGDSSADTLTINSTITSNLIFTDNTYDIGASGATRPRNLFLAGNATIGGAQTLTGALTVDSTTDSSSTTTGSIQTDGGVGIAKALFVGTTANIAGVATFSAGTAALPALTTTGDTNTGIFFPAADTVATSVGGSEGMRLTSTGLGIGTNSPAVKLDVQGASNSSTNWTWAGGNVANPPAGCTYGVLLGRNLSNGLSEANIVWGQGISSNQFLGFGKWTGSAYTEQMRITTAGFVGIASTAPAYQLTVNGSTGIGVGTSNNTGMSLTFSGAIGGDSISEAAKISALYTAYGTNSAGTLIFTTNSGSGLSEKARITAAGNVGIGTTAPSTKLMVEDSIATAYSSTNTLSATPIAYLYNPNGGASVAATLRLDAGTSGGNSATSISAVRTGDGSSALTFGTRNGGADVAERVRITSTGLVGVGTTTPATIVDARGVVSAMSTGVDGTFQPAFNATYSGDTLFYGTIAHSMSSNATASGFRFLGGGKDNITGTGGQQKLLDITRGQTVFYVSDSEVARFNTSGELCIGATTSGSSTLRVKRVNAGAALYASQEVATNNTTATIYQTEAGGNNNQNIGLLVAIQAQGSGDRIICAQFWNAGSPQDKFFVQRDGSTYNATGTYGTISDARVKQDITDASSQWEDVKKIKFRKFRMIDDVTKYGNKAPYLMGPVAQELEEAGMKGLVETPVDKDGNETDLHKTVKLSIMHMKGMKALQEAMARIEQLEARLAAANL